MESPMTTTEAEFKVTHRVPLRGESAARVLTGDGVSLLDQLLAEQQQMTAVERFSRAHVQGELPAQARYYRDLIPLTRPGPGEQYAFVVNLDTCTGCKACVSACHSLNGLEEEETWRSVGLLHSAGVEAYQQAVTTACHHCVEPACLEGCPVMAYDKDEETGIVRHLDDQCIGCQYCMLKCPYDVPKYSKRKGIVRKCDMCSNRLAVGEAPACVQACPTQAIRIEVVNKQQMSQAAKVAGARLIPGAFESSYTKPTTRFHTDRPIPKNVRSAAADALRLEHPHWPLIGMLVLTQLGIGLHLAMLFLGYFMRTAFAEVAAPLSIAAFAALNAGLGVSVLHLGRPLGAWRFFLGLRTSWMSREILAFSVAAGVAAACVISANGIFAAKASLLITTFTSAAGLAAIFCSAMIYIDTRRPFWAASLTIPRFFGPALLLGTAAAAPLILCFDHPSSPNLVNAARAFTAAAILLRAALLSWEIITLRRSLRDPQSLTHRSAQTMQKLCSRMLGACGILSLAVAATGIASLSTTGFASLILASAMLLCTFGAAVIERYLFFTAAAPPRMPEGFAS